MRRPRVEKWPHNTAPIVRKVPKSHLSRVTERGRMAITAVLAARNAATKRLIELAA